MTHPLEELLKGNQEFISSQECVESLELQKCKLVEAPILIFQNWLIKFHVHIDVHGITVTTVLTQLGEDIMDYPNAYSNHKLNKA